MDFRRILREPLTQFLAVGAILFVVAGVTRRGDRDGPEREIVVTEAQILRLIEGWSRTWQRPPTRRELDGLIDDYVEEEVLYREAIALGLDRDDQIIRRRLRQKMEFLSEDIAQAASPTDAELQTFLEENPDKFRLDPRFSFAHVYFSEDRRGGTAGEDAARALGEMSTAGVDVASNYGDPFPLPVTYNDISERDVAGLFGQAFAEAISQLETGSWQGPVTSGYGWHVVYVTSRVDERIPELTEIRDDVEREFMFLRREEMKSGLYDRFREKYMISIEMPQAIAADSTEERSGR